MLTGPSRSEVLEWFEDASADLLDSVLVKLEDEQLEFLQLAAGQELARRDRVVMFWPRPLMGPYLDAFVQVGGFRDQACELLRSWGEKLSPGTVRSWRSKYPEFAEAEDKAKEESTIRLRAESVRRSTGYEVPVVYQGKIQPQLDAEGRPMRDENGDVIPAMVTKYSDHLLMFELKRRDAEYRDRRDVGKGEQVTINQQVVILPDNGRSVSGSVEKARELKEVRELSE